jgi:drug/metabolite transporter (DMT)-like permease
MAQLTSDATASSRDPAETSGPSRSRLLSWPGGFSAWAALFVVWVVWGSTYLAIRVADRSIPPFAMAGARYLAAGAVLYPLAWLGSRRRQAAAAPPAAGAAAPSRLAQWGGMAVVGTLLLAFGNGGVSYAEQTLPSGLAALLVSSVPLWMALADRIINGQRIPLRGWLSLVIGLAGIAVLARPSGTGAVLPVLVVLGASVSWGVGSVLAGRLPAPESPLVGSAMEMLAGGIVLTGMAAVTGELAHIDPAHVSEQSLLGLLYLIGPGSLLALTCYVIALRRLPTAAVSTYAYVNPVVAVSLGALFLSERPTSATLLGGAVVVVAVAMLLTSRQANRKLDRAASRARFPFGPGQRVLDLAALGAFDDVGSLVRDGTHQGQAAFLHDAPGCAIGRHRAREHPLDAKIGESHADHGACPLGGVALVPRGPAQPVAEVDVGGIGVAAGARAEVQPA